MLTTFRKCFVVLFAGGLGLCLGACSADSGGSGNTNSNSDAGNSNGNQNLNDNQSPDSTTNGNLLVATTNPNQPNSGSPVVLEFDGTSGQFLRELTDLGAGATSASLSMAFAANGNLLVAVNDRVQEFELESGEYVQDFVPALGGALSNVRSIVSGPDGDVYVAFESDIVAFDGTTADPRGILVPAGTAGLDTPVALAFGQDGNLLVANEVITDVVVTTVLEFDPQTGEFIRELVEAGSGGLSQTLDMDVGPNGNVYLNNVFTVLEYDGDSGEFIGEFFDGSTSFAVPTAQTFGPDGHLYVLTTGLMGTTAVRQIDGTTGELLGIFAQNESIRTFGHLLFQDEN